MSADLGIPVAAQPVVPDRSSAVRVAAIAAVGVAVLGAGLGFVWSAWSPPGPEAEVLAGGRFLPDETEAFIAGDGRYLVITAVVGLLVAVLAWFGRPAERGPVLLLGVLAGTAAGASLTELIGHLTGGGSFTGKVFRGAGGSSLELTRRLPLSLHAQGLLFVEPAVTALAYGLFVAFAVRDDLGRLDPVRENLLAQASVGAGAHPQDGGGYGNAAGTAQ